MSPKSLLAGLKRLLRRKDLPVSEEEADLIQESFIHAISHDLTNPLTSIEGFLQLLLDPKSPDPLSARQKRMLSTMDRACRHVMGLVRDLSDMARLEMGRLKPQFAPADLRDIAKNAVAEFQIQMENRGVQVLLEMPATLPLVWADARLLEKLFDTLLRNALRFTPDGGRVSVELADAGAWIQGAVWHSGEGLAPEQIESLLHTSLKDPLPPAANAGLGLSLCRNIAEGHGGDLKARAEPGKGTCLLFRLRKAPPPPGP